MPDRDDCSRRTPSKRSASPTPPTSPTPQHPKTAFTEAFLAALADREEPASACEADLSGPWEVRTLEPHHHAVVRAGDDPRRPGSAFAVLADRGLALQLAAVLHALPQVRGERTFHVGRRPKPCGYALHRGGFEGSGFAGWVRDGSPELLGLLEVASALARRPAALALLLEAAGPGALRRVGTLLGHRLAPQTG